MPEYIDMTPAVEAIRRKYPDYYRNAQAHTEMADLWGGVSCNPFGVIEPSEHLQIALKGHPRWDASIWLAETPKGHWLIETGYHYPDGGRSGPISIWNRRAYRDRDAAISAAVGELTEQLQRLRDGPFCTNAQQLLADRLIEQLAAQIAKPQQMNLF